MKTEERLVFFSDTFLNGDDLSKDEQLVLATKARICTLFPQSLGSHQAKQSPGQQFAQFGCLRSQGGEGEVLSDQHRGGLVRGLHHR